MQNVGLIEQFATRCSALATATEMRDRHDARPEVDQLVRDTAEQAAALPGGEGYAFICQLSGRIRMQLATQQSETRQYVIQLYLEGLSASAKTLSDKKK